MVERPHGVQAVDVPLGGKQVKALISPCLGLYGCFCSNRVMEVGTGRRQEPDLVP